MGCGDSQEAAAFWNKLPVLWQNDFTAIGLNKNEVYKMRDVFQHLDRDHSGKVSYYELLMHIDVDPTMFTDRMFKMFDRDHSGSIDFREYVLAVWNYCTLSQKTIGMFAFGIYDKDHSGNLSPSEVEKMIRDIYGKKADTSVDVKHVCAELKKMGKNEKLDDLRFNMFAQTHHNLLYPAWFFQEQLQQHVINQSFWGKKTIQRSERSSQGYASLDQIIGKDYSSKKRFSVGGGTSDPHPSTKSQSKKSISTPQVHPGGSDSSSSRGLESEEQFEPHAPHFPKHRENDSSQPDNDPKRRKSRDDGDHEHHHHRSSQKRGSVKKGSKEDEAAAKLQARVRGSMARQKSEHVKNKSKRSTKAG